MEDGACRLFEEWKDVGLVLGEHLFGSVVVSCAEDGFEFRLGFGKYALEFVFHGKL